MLVIFAIRFHIYIYIYIYIPETILIAKISSEIIDCSNGWAEKKRITMAADVVLTIPSSIQHPLVFCVIPSIFWISTFFCFFFPFMKQLDH